MEHNTDQMHRLLALWLDLHNAVAQAKSLNHRSHPPDDPWNSGNARVREIWNTLTHPDNLLALEQWLCQCSDGQTAEWARKALLACRERRRH